MDNAVVMTWVPTAELVPPRNKVVLGWWSPTMFGNCFYMGEGDWAANQGADIFHYEPCATPYFWAPAPLAPQIERERLASG